MEKSISVDSGNSSGNDGGNFTVEEKEFAENFSKSTEKQADDFGFGQKEREGKAEKRKELLDKMLAIDIAAKEKISILEDIGCKKSESKYVSGDPSFAFAKSFPDQLVSLAKDKVDRFSMLKYSNDPKERGMLNNNIFEIEEKIKDAIQRYFLGEDNKDVENLVSLVVENNSAGYREVDKNLSERKIEWKNLLSEERKKIIDEMELTNKQFEENIKEEIKKIEKEKTEKDEFFGRVVLLREDLYKHLDLAMDKFNAAKGVVKTGSEKEMMEYLPDIIELTPDEKIEEAVKKVYMTPGRRGTKSINTMEEAMVYSELTGIDSDTFKNIIQRIYPVWPSAELIKEMGYNDRPEYYKNLKDKYIKSFDKLRICFSWFAEEDGKRLNDLMKGELRGENAKEAFQISERVEFYRGKLCDQEISGINIKDIYEDVRKPKEQAGMDILSPERMDWLVSPILVYYDPKEDFAYTETEVLSEEVKNRLEERIGYCSQSRRAFFIINDDRTITEFKGFSPANLEKRNVVESSGAPEGVLDALEGRREKTILNDIGSVEAEFKLVKEKCRNIDRKEMDYGILRRKAKKGEEFMPFLRIATPDKVVDKLAEHKKISSVEFIEQSAKVFAKELGGLHRNGIFDGAEYEDRKYKSWLHASNVEIHGHIIDVGSTSTIDRMVGEEFDPGNSEHLKILTAYKAKDIDRFFGGNREVQHTKDTGYYGAKLKESPEFLEGFVGSFIEIYLSGTSTDERKKIVDRIMEETGKTKKWTEGISRMIAEAHTKQMQLNVEKK